MNFLKSDSRKQAKTIVVSLQICLDNPFDSHEDSALAIQYFPVGERRVVVVVVVDLVRAWAIAQVTKVARLRLQENRERLSFVIFVLDSLKNHESSRGLRFRLKPRE